MAMRCEVNDQVGVQIMAEGNIRDIISDVMHLINALYSDLLDSNKTQADFFKFAMDHAVNDANSPLWVPRKKDEGDLSIHIPLSPDGFFDKK